MKKSEVFKDENEVQAFISDLKKTTSFDYKKVVELIERLPKKPFFLHNLSKNYTIKDGGIDMSLLLIDKKNRNNKYYIEISGTYSVFINVYRQSEPRQRFNKFPFYKEIVITDLF